MPGNYQNKVVLITGASSGIGEALAFEFAREGAVLALLARRIERLDELVTRLQKQGTRALALQCDVTRDGDLEKAAASTREKLGRIDVVVANAGFGVSGKLDRLKIEDYRRQFETNIFGVLRTIFATLEDLKKSRGKLVIIGSVAGYVALPGSSAYSMSKFCVRGLAESITEELRSEGVCVTLISPGFVKSDFKMVDRQEKTLKSTEDGLVNWLMMPTPLAAQKIVRAVTREKREEVITRHGKLAVWIQRHFPALVNYAKSKVFRVRKKPRTTV